MEYYQRAMGILQKELSPNHEDIKMLMDYINEVEKLMKNGRISEQ
jgi:hypothetical protein